MTPSLGDRIPGIFLAAFLTIVSATDAEARNFNPAEKWVIEMVTAGKIADLGTALNVDQTMKFPDEKDRKLRAQFLEDLLTGMLPGVKPHRNGVRIRGAIIDEPIDIRNAQISWEVWLLDFRFNDANFSNANFAGNLAFNGRLFRSGADFSGMKVGRTVIFRNVVFQRMAEFTGAEIADNFIADNARFSKRGAAVFNSIKVGHTAFFEEAVFEGAVDFRAADIECNFEARNTEFRSQILAVQLQMKCGRKAIFTGATFAGPVSFADSSFLDLMVDGMDADAAPVPSMDLSRTTIKRLLSIPKIRVRDLTASSLNVEGPADFSNVIVDRSADLSYSNFATLDLSNSVWPINGKNGAVFRLQGANYKYVRANLDERQSHKALLKLAQQSAFTADVYGNLEAFFLRQGYGADADQAFIAGKRREREEVLRRKEYLNWIGSKLLDWLVGYGRHPWQAGVPCAFFVVLGCFLFSSRKMDLQKPDDAPRVYNSFWYSLSLFLPIVDLQMDKVWKPKPEQTFLRNYMRVHILLGWILIPIVLAALTGLIK